MVDDGVGVLREALYHARDESLRVDHFALEPRISSGEEREDENRQEGSDVGLEKRVSRSVP